MVDNNLTFDIIFKNLNLDKSSKEAQRYFASLTKDAQNMVMELRKIYQANLGIKLETPGIEKDSFKRYSQDINNLKFTVKGLDKLFKEAALSVDQLSASISRIPMPRIPTTQATFGNIAEQKPKQKKTTKAIGEESDEEAKFIPIAEKRIELEDELAKLRNSPDRRTKTGSARKKKWEEENQAIRNQMTSLDALEKKGETMVPVEGIVTETPGQVLPPKKKYRKGVTEDEVYGRFQKGTMPAGYMGQLMDEQNRFGRKRIKELTDAQHKSNRENLDDAIKEQQKKGFPYLEQEKEVKKEGTVKRENEPYVPPIAGWKELNAEIYKSIENIIRIKEQVKAITPPIELKKAFTQMQLPIEDIQVTSKSIDDANKGLFEYYNINRKIGDRQVKAGAASTIYDKQDNKTYLSDIYTQAQERGQGYGKRMMDEIVKVADQRQSQIKLDAVPEKPEDYDKLIKFYEGYGFTKTSPLGNEMTRTPGASVSPGIDVVAEKSKGIQVSLDSWIGLSKVIDQINLKIKNTIDASKQLSLPTGGQLSLPPHIATNAEASFEPIQQTFQEGLDLDRFIKNKDISISLRRYFNPKVIQQVVSPIEIELRRRAETIDKILSDIGTKSTMFPMEDIMATRQTNASDIASRLQSRSVKDKRTAAVREETAGLEKYTQPGYDRFDTSVMNKTFAETVSKAIQVNTALQTMSQAIQQTVLPMRNIAGLLPPGPRENPIITPPPIGTGWVSSSMRGQSEEQELSIFDPKTMSDIDAWRASLKGLSTDVFGVINANEKLKISEQQLADGRIRAVGQVERAPRTVQPMFMEKQIQAMSNKWSEMLMKAPLSQDKFPTASKEFAVGEKFGNMDILGILPRQLATTDEAISRFQEKIMETATASLQAKDATAAYDYELHKLADGTRVLTGIAKQKPQQQEEEGTDIKREPIKLNARLADWQNPSPKDLKQFRSEVDRETAIINAKYKSVGLEAQISYNRMSDGSLRASASLREITNSAKQNLFSLESFLAKIQHYIVFSLGVQMVMGIKKGLNDAIEGFKAFEKAATNAAAVSGYIGGAFEEVRQRIMALSKEMGTKTVYSAQEVAESFYTISQAGIDVAKVGEKELLPILQYAQATQSDLTDATQAVLTTMFSFGMQVSETSEIVDTFTEAVTSSFLSMESLAEAMKYVGPIAGEVGMSVQETAASIALLGQRGMLGSQAGQRLTMVLTKLLDPTGEAKDTIEKLGLTLEDVDPTINSFADILTKLQYAGFSAADASEMFRSRTAAAAMMLVSNAEDVAYLTTQYQYATGVTQELADAQANTLFGATTKINNEIKNLSIEFGQNLAPLVIQMQTLIKAGLAPVLENLGNVVDFVAKNWGAFQLMLKLATIGITLYIAKMIYAKALIAKTKISNSLLALSFRDVGASSKGASTGFAAYEAGAAGIPPVSKAAEFSVRTLSNSIKELLASIPIFGWISLGITAVTTALLFWPSASDKASKSTEKLAVTASDTAKLIGTMGIAADSTSTEMMDLFKTMMKGADDSENFKNNVDAIAKKYKEITGKEFVYRIRFEGTPLESIELPEEFYSPDMKLVKDSFSSLDKAIRAVIDEEREVYEIQFALTDAFENNKSVIQLYTESLINLKSKNELLATAQSKVNSVISEHADNAELLASAQEKLTIAQQNQSDAFTSYLSSAKQVIKAIRSVPGELDFYISKLEEAMGYEAERKTLLDDQKRAIEDVTDSSEAYSQAILQYGISSDQAQDALKKLNNVIKTKIDIDQKISDLQVESGTNIDIVNNALKGQFVTMEDVSESVDSAVTKYRTLSKAETGLLEDAKNIITSRERMISLQTDYENNLRKQETLEAIRSDTSKVLEENLKKYYETQNKIYDIEYKLYKLRNDEDTQLEGMFNTLAEQGMLTEDVINGYVDMKTTEGELMGLNMEYAGVVEQLGSEQRLAVAEFLKTGEGLENVSDLTDEQIDVISRYQEAYSKSQNATSSFSDTLTPLIDTLVDMNVVSSDTAKGFYDYISNAGEAAIANYDLSKLTKDLNPTFKLVSENIALMGQSLIDGTDGFENMQDVLPEVAKNLGMEGTDIYELADILGISSSEASKMSDEQLIMALSLKKVAKDLGYYTKGMKASVIMEKQGLATKDDFTSVQEGVLKTIRDTMAEMPTYKQLVDDVAVSYDKWQDEIKTFEGLFIHMTDSYNVTVSGMKNNPIDPGVEYQDILDMKDTVLPGLRSEWDKTAAKLAKTIYAEIRYNTTYGTEGKLSTSTGKESMGLSDQQLDEAFKGTNLPPETVDKIKSKIKAGKMYAKGGIVNSPEYSLMGEAGPEAILPLGRNKRKYSFGLLSKLFKMYPDFYKKFIRDYGGDNFKHGGPYNPRRDLDFGKILPIDLNPIGIGKKLPIKNPLSDSIKPWLGGIPLGENNSQKLNETDNFKSLYKEKLESMAKSAESLRALQANSNVGANYDYSNNPVENYTITGPINVQGVANAEDFSDKLKFKMRSSS